MGEGVQFQELEIGSMGVCRYSVVVIGVTDAYMEA